MKTRIELEHTDFTAFGLVLNGLTDSDINRLVQRAARNHSIPLDQLQSGFNKSLAAVRSDLIRILTIPKVPEFFKQDQPFVVQPNLPICKDEAAPRNQVTPSEDFGNEALQKEIPETAPTQAPNAGSFYA